MSRSSPGLLPLVVSLCVLATARAEEAGGDETGALTVTTWGGAYEVAQQEALFAPIARESGVEIRLKAYDGGVAPLRGGGWDVLDMSEPDAIAACARGLLASFDPGSLLPAPDGTPAYEDFLSGSFLECGVVHLVYSTVLAYDDRAFPGEKPRTVRDFFDLERFPGPRALRRRPIALLEWSLLSYGIPISQLYDLLSTERGMTLAVRRLDEIRDHIVWWENGSEPPELLEHREVVMASGFNGRFFNARVNEGIPITVIWDGQLLDASVWAIARDSPRRALAEKFIAFATRAENMAAFAHIIPYGPSRRSAIGRVGLHARSKVPMLAHMPTAPGNLRRAIRSDSLWYARTEALRKRRFTDWLAADRGS